MGISTSFHLVYGYELSANLKSRTTGKEFDPHDEKFIPYLEGQQEVVPFTLIWDQMGSDQPTIFGQQLCMSWDDGVGVKEVDIDRLEKDKLKKLYSELFEDFDVPDVEPKLLCITHQS